MIFDAVQQYLITYSLAISGNCQIVDFYLIIKKSDEMGNHYAHLIIAVLAYIWDDKFLSLGCAEEASFVMKGLELSAFKVLIFAVVMVQLR